MNHLILAQKIEHTIAGSLGEVELIFFICYLEDLPLLLVLLCTMTLLLLQGNSILLPEIPSSVTVILPLPLCSDSFLLKFCSGSTFSFTSESVALRQFLLVTLGIVVLVMPSCVLLDFSSGLTFNLLKFSSSVTCGVL